MAEDTPLAVGQVHGFRAWRITQDGLLTPISQHSAQNWHDGENVASCVGLAARSPEVPQPPVPPRHPDDVDPSELIHREDVDYGIHHRAGRTLRVSMPDENDRRRTLPQLVSGPGVSISDEQRSSWQEMRRRAIEEYQVSMKRYEKNRQLYEHDQKIFQRRYAEYEQEVQDHIAPVEECDCGFYMVRERRLVPGGSGIPTALGVVQGYGRVVPYAEGWRFGKGRILALMILSGLREPRMMYYGLNQEHRVTEIEKQRNDDLEFKLKSNYSSAKFYDDEQNMLLDWNLVVSRS